MKTIPDFFRGLFEKKITDSVGYVGMSGESVSKIEAPDGELMYEFEPNHFPHIETLLAQAKQREKAFDKKFVEQFNRILSSGEYELKFGNSPIAQPMIVRRNDDTSKRTA